MLSTIVNWLLTFLPQGILITFVIWHTFKSKRYKLMWKLCAIFLVSSMLCFIINKGGAYIDKSNIVHEVGLMLPIGALLLCLGIISIVIIGILYLSDFKMRD